MKNHKKLPLLTLILTALLALAGCGTTQNPASENEAREESGNQADNPIETPPDEAEYPADEPSEPDTQTETGEAPADTEEAANNIEIEPPIEEAEPPAKNEPAESEEAPTDPEPDTDPVNENEICEFCGDHYIGQDLRAHWQTPPMNIRDVGDWMGVDIHINEMDAFLSSFETVHNFTFLQWETEWYRTLVLWPDRTLTNFSFVELGMYDDEYESYFYVLQELLAIDELRPNHAVVLNVAFFHYMIPSGGLVFTDENGEQVRMLILDASSRGGCWPHFGLGVHSEDFWAGWRE